MIKQPYLLQDLLIVHLRVQQMSMKFFDTMHHFIQNHVVAIDNLAWFCILSGYTCSFCSVLTCFVVKYGQLFVLIEQCNRNSEECN